MLVALVLAAAAPGSAWAADVLPDLAQQQPRRLEIALDRQGAIPRFHLGFDSLVDNRGAGPLTIEAHRSSTNDQRMVADQRVLQDDGGTRLVEGIGALQFTYSPDHNHWHYLGFDRYELRRTSDYLLVAPDQKTGFCLGDRYETDPDTSIPGEPPEAVYTSQCGLGRPDLLEVREGISPGYGDVYYAQLEGQFVDVTGVDAGQYYLVHRANADHKLAESDYTNNASSLLISLAWPRGHDEAPSIKVLRRCTESESCPGPDQEQPVLDRLAARHYTRVALRRTLHFTPRGFRIDCSRRLADGGRRCSARGSRKRKRYSAGVTVRYERANTGVLYTTYAVSGTRKDLRCAARRRSGCTIKLPRRTGRVRIGPVAPPASARVAQSRERLVALDDPPLDGVTLGPVVDEVPSLVRHPSGGVGSGVAAK
jgi:hypothetical protein